MPKRDEGGFTLIETMVVLILTSILFNLTLSFLRSSNLFLFHAQTLSREGEEVDRIFRIVQKLLTGPSTIRSTESRSRKIFEGSKDEVQFLGPMPDEGGSDDAVAYRVFSGADHRFHVSWHFDRDEQSKASFGYIGDEVSFSTNVSVAFSYFGSMDEHSVPKWADNWTDTSRLPDIIALDFSRSGKTIKYFIRVATVHRLCQNPANYGSEDILCDY